MAAAKIWESTGNYIVFEMSEFYERMDAIDEGSATEKRQPLFPVYKNAAGRVAVATSVRGEDGAKKAYYDPHATLRGKVQGEVLGALTWSNIKDYDVCDSQTADKLADDFHRRRILTPIEDASPQPPAAKKIKPVKPPRIKKERKKKDTSKRSAGTGNGPTLDYRLMALANEKQDKRRETALRVGRGNSEIPVHTGCGDEWMAEFVDSLSGADVESTTEAIVCTLGYQAGWIDCHTNKEPETAGYQSLRVLEEAEIKGRLLHDLHVKFCEKDFVKTAAVICALNEGVVEAQDLRDTLNGYKAELTSQKIYDDIKVIHPDFGYAPKYECA